MYWVSCFEVSKRKLPQSNEYRLYTLGLEWCSIEQNINFVANEYFSKQNGLPRLPERKRITVFFVYGLSGVVIIVHWPWFNLMRVWKDPKKE